MNPGSGWGISTPFPGQQERGSMKKLLMLTVAVVVLMGVVPAHADVVAISQNTGNATATFGAGLSFAGVGQSFQLASAADITALDVDLVKLNSPSDSVKVELLSGNITSGAVLASASVLGSTFTPAGFYRFSFAPVALAASTTYYVRVTRTGATDAVNAYRTRLSLTNPYAGGQQYTRSSLGTWTAHSNNDLRFQVITP